MNSIKTEKDIIIFLTKSFIGKSIISTLFSELYIEPNKLVLIVHTIKGVITFEVICRITFTKDYFILDFNHPISFRAMYLILGYEKELSIHYIFNFNLPSI